MVGISGKSLLSGMFLLIAIVGALMGLYVLLDISGLTVGTVTNVAVGDFNGSSGGGNINVSTAMKTHLQGLETTYITDADAVTTNSGLIISLVAIVVIILVFGLEDFFRNFTDGVRKGGVQ